MFSIISSLTETQCDPGQKSHYLFELNYSCFLLFLARHS